MVEDVVGMDAEMLEELKGELKKAGARTARALSAALAFGFGVSLSCVCEARDTAMWVSIWNDSKQYAQRVDRISKRFRLNSNPRARVHRVDIAHCHHCTKLLLRNNTVGILFLYLTAGQRCFATRHTWYQPWYRL